MFNIRAVMIALVVILFSATIYLSNDVLFGMSLFLIIGSVVTNFTTYMIVNKYPLNVFIYFSVQDMYYKSASAVGYIFGVIFFVTGYYFTGFLLLLATVTDAALRKRITYIKDNYAESVQRLDEFGSAE
ncbi:MAG: hypothetical protein ACK4PR_01280 [Gammaproteobacteria bacterium]